ncbi:MAG: hypothetical protein RTV31_00665 [Candidatus Thorarchaeota archaeon]
MRKQVLSIFAVVLAVAICTSSVAAANNQNLAWGISVGQRLDYNYHSETQHYNETDIKDVNFYNIIESLPAISDDIDTLGEFPSTPSRTCYYSNGTETTYPYIWYAVPIGNWDLVIDLWELHPGINESHIIDTPEVVGYNSTWSWDGGNTTYIYAELYSRSTGVIQTYQKYSPMSEDFIIDAKMVLIPSSDIIYIVAGVGVAAVVLVAIVLLKRK